MKKFLKLFISVSLMLSLMLITQVSASESNDDLLTVKKLSSQARITITNNETGEVNVLNPINVKDNSYMKVNSIIPDDESIKVGYDVFIPIEALNSKGITTQSISDGGSADVGVYAKLYVDYDVSLNNEQVRVNKIWGSWSPSSSLFYLTNREVNVHSGLITGKKLTKYPTSNTFSYTTGWGYNDRVWGSGSPRAWSSAIVHVSGMSATHTITVSFPFS